MERFTHSRPITSPRFSTLIIGSANRNASACVGVPAEIQPALVLVIHVAVQNERINPREPRNLFPRVAEARGLLAVALLRAVRVKSLLAQNDAAALFAEHQRGP